FCLAGDGRLDPDLDVIGHGLCGWQVASQNPQHPDCTSRTRRHGFAWRIRFSGVSAALPNRVNPARLNTSASRASPAWAPSAAPTSCDSEFGAQMAEEAW